MREIAAMDPFSSFNIVRICLFTGEPDECKHPECIYRKSAAQSRPANAVSAGMLSQLQGRTERARFRESMAMEARRKKGKMEIWRPGS